jgi:hypothetical protein
MQPRAESDSMSQFPLLAAPRTPKSKGPSQWPEAKFYVRRNYPSAFLTGFRCCKFTDCQLGTQKPHEYPPAGPPVYSRKEIHASTAERGLAPWLCAATVSRTHQECQTKNAIAKVDNSAEFFCEASMTQRRNKQKCFYLPISHTWQTGISIRVRRQTWFAGDERIGRGSIAVSAGRGCESVRICGRH